MEEKAVGCEISQDQSFKEWWKKHWKKVVAGAIIVGGTILVIRNWDEITAIAEELTSVLKPEIKDLPHVVVASVVEEASASPVREMAKNTIRNTPEAPFNVIAHIRNLPEGWRASPEKIAEAEALQIVLLPNQTIVDAYIKSAKVA